MALEKDDPVTAAALAKPKAEANDAEAQFVMGFLHDVGAGVEFDRAGALLWLNKAADQNHPLARRYLHWKYESGFGVEKNAAKAGAYSQDKDSLTARPTDLPGQWLSFDGPKPAPNLTRAFLWMQNEADGGNRLAQANLALVYVETGWTTPDSGQHLYWLRQAGANGHAPSLERLAFYYEGGLGVEQDDGRARYYRRAAAEAGSANAQFEIGSIYERGHNVTQNEAEAARWYRRAAEQGHLKAMVRLGGLLRKGAVDLPVDLTESLRLARQAAALGNAEAMSDVAGMLREGQGAPRDIAGAVSYYRQAADLGYPFALLMLGWMHRYGDVEQKQDFAQAKRWFEQAAAKENTRAMRELGLMYANGLGVEKDPKLAFDWFERAAREGDLWSQNQLGWMLRNGIGIARDDEEAFDWFQLAAKNGHVMADAHAGFHLLHGRGVARDPLKALHHLARALRTLSDDWILTTFTDVFRRAKRDELPALKTELGKYLDDPQLLQLGGKLPEACLGLLFIGPNGIKNEEQGKALLQKMIVANRPTSWEQLAWHAFTGVGIPYNLAQSRHWARLAAGRDPKSGAYWLAFIESAGAEAAADRDQARQKLRELAEGGLASATFALAYRLAVGETEEIDPEAAVRYFNLAARLRGEKPEKDLDSFEEVCRRLRIPLSTAPTEESLAMKISQHRSLSKHPERPQVVYPRQPFYPMELRRLGIQGEALIAMTIDPDGRTKNVRVKKASHPLFAAAAVTAVKLWRFAPALKAGEAVTIEMEVPIVFKLRGNAPSILSNPIATETSVPEVVEIP